nr:Ig mu heavy chain disease protein [Columba livia]
MVLAPSPVAITWEGSDVTDDVIITHPITTDSLAPVLFVSHLRLPHGRTHKCRLAHPPTACQGPTVPPEVQVLSSSSCRPTMGGEDTVELLCIITGFSPPTVEVDWLVDGAPGHVTATAMAPRPEEDGGTTYWASSRTNVTREEWLEGRSFSCRVKHPPSGLVTVGHARFCTGLEKLNPKHITIHVLPPTVGDLYVTRQPNLRCVVTNLPSDLDLQLSWTKATPGVLSPDMLDLREEVNGTLTATSTLRISTDDWEAGERFTCRVGHRDLLVPLNRSIVRGSGKVTAPLIFLLPPHPEELQHPTLTLTCLIHGFHPDNLEVRWLKNHQDIPMDTYVTTPPLRDGTQEVTFFAYSKLRVLKSSWLAGDVYSCLVVHEGLTLKMAQRQVQKNPGK